MATLKGIFPNPKPPRKKNYVKENVKSLRRMEKYFHSNKEIEKMEQLQMKRQKDSKYHSIAARVNSSLHGSSTISGDNNYVGDNFHDSKKHFTNNKCNVPTPVKDVPMINQQPSKSINNKHQLVPEINLKEKLKINHRPNVIQSTNCNLPDALNLMNINQDFNSHDKFEEKITHTNRGIQTMNTTNIDKIYSEGVIRYPSSKGQRPVLEKTCKQTDTNFQINGGDTKNDPDLTGPKENINYVKTNKQISVASKMATQLNDGAVPPNYRKGVIPKYIIDRKEEKLHKQIEKAKIEAANADCPQGYVPLPDNERKETLRMLSKNYEGLVNDLNKLPIRSDTLRSQRRKMELEQQLKKLEDGIKVFSRPKVFIKTNE